MEEKEINLNGCLKYLVAIFIIICNVFLSYWVTFKCYLMFKDEVGFELPELTFKNIIALILIAKVIKGFKSSYSIISLSSIEKKLKIDEEHIKDSLLTSGFIVSFWLTAYLIKIFVF